MTLLSVLVLLAIYGLVTERAGLFKDDTRHYGLMAEDPTYLPRLPYTFRVLTPLLVYLLPLEAATGFAVVTILGLAATGVCLYALLRLLELGRWPALAGLALFLGSGATTRTLTTPTYVDPLTYLTEVAAFLCLALRRDLWFGLTLALGVLNRETVFLLAPVYLLQLRDEGRLVRNSLPRIVLVLGLPFASLALIAVVKLLLGGAPTVGLGGLTPLPRTFQQTVPTAQELADVYTVFGAAWLLALLNVRRAPALLRQGMIFGALLVLQLAVSRGDESRNLSHLLPLVIPLAALEFRGLTARMGVALLLACLASMVNYRWVLLPNVAVRYALVGFGSLAAFALAFSRRWGQRARPVEHSPVALPERLPR